ncbi:MAG: hypothetical protein HN759_07420 [Akkermansiaceae bacterium]|nr:hypothetical protein [Akkermansiaceae bacterium]
MRDPAAVVVCRGTSEVNADGSPRRDGHGQIGKAGCCETYPVGDRVIGRPSKDDVEVIRPWCRVT